MESPRTYVGGVPSGGICRVPGMSKPNSDFGTEYDPRAKLLTTEAVAERVAAAPSSVTRWRKEGLLPSVKIGGRWLFSEAALVSFIAARTVEAREGSA